MPASQVQARGTAADDRWPSAGAGEDPAGAGEDRNGAGEERIGAGAGAGFRVAWRRRLCPSSFALAGLTAVIVWVAVTALLRRGQLATVLSAGRAELAAPLLVALVVATSIC